MGETSKLWTSCKTLALLIAIGSCLRIFAVLQHNPMDYLWSDPLRHWENGGLFPRGRYTGAADPIMYQVYIFGLRRLTADNRILVALATAILSVLMPWTYYRAARNFGLQKNSALWVWLLIVWTPSLFAIYHFIMMETLLLFLEGVALWMTARHLRKGGSQAFLISVFFWTLACLTKPTIIPLAGVCVLWSCWKKAVLLRDLAVAAVLAAVLLVPQAIRSKVQLGFVAPFGNPWLTKIQHRSGARTIYVYFYTHASELFHFKTSAYEYGMYFRSPSCSMQPLSPFSSWSIRRSLQDSKVTVIVHAENGARDWANAYAGLNVGAKEWLAQWGENIVLFFFAPSWPESAVHQWDDWLAYITRWMWAPLIVIVLGCNFRQFLHRRFELIPVAVTVFTLFLAFQNVVTAEGRYRKPLEPLLLLNLVWVLGSGRATGHGSRRGIEDDGSSPIPGPPFPAEPRGLDTHPRSGDAMRYFIPNTA